MRICVLSASTFSQEGGIQRVTHTVLRLLREHFPDSPLDLFSLHDDPAARPCKELAEAAREGPFGYHPFGASRVRYSHAVMRFLLTRQPELVISDHAHLDMLPWLAKRWYGFRFVSFVYHAELATLKALRRRALRSSDLIIAISEFTAREARRVLGPHERLVVCHLGLHPDYPTWVEHAPPAPAALAGRRVVLIVGRMVGPSRDKGHETLIRAMPDVARRVPDALLVMVGQGEDRPRLGRLVQELNVAGHVYFAGAVPDTALPAYYEAAEVFAMPSYAEGFGLVYLEAMYHGKPCLAGNADAAREVVLDRETGLLVEPGNVAQTRDAVLDLLLDPARALALGQAGRVRFQEHFSNAHFAQRLLPLFEPAEQKSLSSVVA
jgi:glycosyltransferase involved in cell wall biosynthesis